MSKSQDLREQRCKLIADARTVMDSADVLDAEQRSQVDAMLNDADTLKQDIDRMEAIEAEERQLTASAGKVADIAVSKAEKPLVNADSRPPLPANFSAKPLASNPPDFRFPLFLAPFALPSFIE